MILNFIFHRVVLYVYCCFVDRYAFPNLLSYRISFSKYTLTELRINLDIWKCQVVGKPETLLKQHVCMSFTKAVSLVPRFLPNDQTELLEIYNLKPCVVENFPDWKLLFSVPCILHSNQNLASEFGCFCNLGLFWLNKNLTALSPTFFNMKSSM